MPNISVNHKQKQIPLSQYEAWKAKKDKRKPAIDLPGPVFLIFIAPIAFLLILIVGYIFYVRTLAVPAP